MTRTTMHGSRRGLDRVADGKDFAGEPRPIVIVQDDNFDATNSIIVSAFITDPTEAPLFRLTVGPDDHEGRWFPSRLMVDKITTVAKAKLGQRIGRPDDEDMVQLNQSVMGLPRAGGVAERAGNGVEESGRSGVSSVLRAVDKVTTRRCCGWSHPEESVDYCSAALAIISCTNSSASLLICD